MQLSLINSPILLKASCQKEVTNVCGTPNLLINHKHSHKQVPYRSGIYYVVKLNPCFSVEHWGHFFISFAKLLNNLSPLVWYDLPLVFIVLHMLQMHLQTNWFNWENTCPSVSEKGCHTDTIIHLRLQHWKCVHSLLLIEVLWNITYVSLLVQWDNLSVDLYVWVFSQTSVHPDRSVKWKWHAQGYRRKTNPWC